MIKTIITGLVSLLVAANCAFAASSSVLPAKILRFVPQADLKVLDPMYTTNYVTRNFGYMVYDTLFSQDAQGVPQPQMVEKYAKSQDGRRWTFTLRPGLEFQDGSALTSADCIASLKRWATKDSYGGAMMAAGAKWESIDDHTFTLTLDKPFGLVLEALSKVSSYAPFIMSEKAITAAGIGPVTDINSSGPYIFKRDEWAPGNKVVFVRNPHYVGRSDPPSYLAGNKSASNDRVEWLILPDANSASAALMSGEVDVLELVPPDNVPSLRTDPDVKVGTGGAYQASLIVNQLHPPFNNAQARQAMLYAVNQEAFMAGMGYGKDMRLKHCSSFFICGAANDTNAGSEPFQKPNIEKARQLLVESGYKGEKVVVLVPTDYANLNSAALITIQTMKQVGFKVDAQSMDWATIVSRRVKKVAPEEGGWSAYATFAVASSVDSPLSNFMLGARCGNSMPGWPCDEELDALRAAWVRATDSVTRKDALDRFQRRAFEVVPYIPLGQYSGVFAVRKVIKNYDALHYDVPTLWRLGK
ncbi:ABC transporter substrate-binding protein [Allopusillimonas ginsengisoli]|uniref:ABC transporter substrate-binding protein n=1 Tax=Allopusillimonas ginsengisoli TaxID=453575 RepID=UPI00101F7A49|nr:ABC transporter substrate-binding protein [Allopusillimonas ginsengisoli]TEA77750.1 ABC transporter substrate-binding protein [Allopusillimonas ginsengisoli]